MHTITIEQAKDMNSFHGDFWNEQRLAKIVFSKHPTAVKFEYSLGSGLYAQVTCYTEEGEKFIDTVYDGRDDHYLK